MSAMTSTPPGASAAARSRNSARFSPPSRWWIASEETMAWGGEVEGRHRQPVGRGAAGRARPLPHLGRTVEGEHPAGRKAVQQRAAQQPLAGAQLDQQRAVVRRRDQLAADGDLPLALGHEVAAVVEEPARVVLVPAFGAP